MWCGVSLGLWCFHHVETIPSNEIGRKRRAMNVAALMDTHSHGLGSPPAEEALWHRSDRHQPGTISSLLFPPSFLLDWTGSMWRAQEFNFHLDDNGSHWHVLSRAGMARPAGLRLLVPTLTSCEYLCQNLMVGAAVQRTRPEIGTCIS